jgi:hypothetical protein
VWQIGHRVIDHCGGGPPTGQPSFILVVLGRSCLTPTSHSHMEGDSSRYKRRRSPSTSSSSSSGESDPEGDLSPAPKYHRSTPSSSLPFTCTLPPTCSQPGTVTAYATESELERHQDAFHRWICRTPIRNKPRPGDEAAVPEAFVSKRNGFNGEVWKECGKVFPDERLLHLVSCPYKCGSTIG